MPSSPIQSYEEVYNQLQDKLNSLDPKILEVPQVKSNNNDEKPSFKIGNIFQKVKNINPIVINVFIFVLISILLLIFKPKLIKKDEKVVPTKIILFSLVFTLPSIIYFLFTKFYKKG